MATENPRARRVGEQLKRELAQLIHDELQDPRLGMVTVSAVQVSRDLAHAKVYVTVLGPDGVQAESLQVLNHAAGFLRHLLGRCLILRSIPQLHFVYDESVERGRHLTELIEQAVAADSHDASENDS